MADFKGAKMGGVAALWLMLSAGSASGVEGARSQLIQDSEGLTQKTQAGITPIPSTDGVTHLMRKFNPPAPVVVPVGCDASLFGDLTHKSVHRELFSPNLERGSSSALMSPQAIQDKAKALFEDRKKFYEDIFSCKTENSELHDLAKELRYSQKNSTENYETLKQILNLVVIDHYAEAAEHFSVEYFQDKARDRVDVYRDFYGEKSKSLAKFDYSGVMSKIKQDVLENHAELVRLSVRDDLENVFNAPSDRHPLMTLDRIIDSRLGEELLRIKARTPQTIPYDPGPRSDTPALET